MGIPFNAQAPTVGTPGIAPVTSDKANLVIAGAFTAGGQVSAAAPIYGSFTVSIWANGGPNGAWVASIQLEKSYDGGTTWIVAGVGGSGAQAIFNTGQDVSIPVNEPEQGVGYRLDCTAYTSGEPINYRISATGVLATSNGIPS